jgi:hypothetical protein
LTEILAHHFYAHLHTQHLETDTYTHSTLKQTLTHHLHTHTQAHTHTHTETHATEDKHKASKHLETAGTCADNRRGGGR